MQSVADAGLVGAVRMERERVFVDLLLPLVQPGHRLACAMLHDSYAAEDVVQEASLKAWRKLPNLSDHGHIRAWFLGIVANECRNARRKRWITRVEIGLPARLSTRSPEDRILTGADMRRALMRLGHRERLIVSLYFYLDLPLDEVAAVAGCSVAAARSQLYRGIRRLRPGFVIQEALP